MKNQFLDYNTSIQLKELGFNKDCYSYYFIYEDKLRQDFANVEFDYRNKNEFVEPVNNYDSLEEYATAPLYQQAFKWFRDKYNLVITIIPSYNYEYFTYYYKCYDGIGKKSYEDSRLFRTYEEAEFECLKNLIQIAKN